MGNAEHWSVRQLIGSFMAAPGCLSPQTWEYRRAYAEKVCGDRLGACRVGALCPVVVEGAIERWNAAGLSGSQVRGRVAVVRLAVSWAYGQGLVARAVLAGLEGVAQERPRLHLPVPVVRCLLSAARGEVRRLRARCPRAGRRELFRAEQDLLLMVLVADTGLRRGELAGLRSDDLWGRELWLERAAKTDAGAVVIGPTKSHRSGRLTASAATARWWRAYAGRWFGREAVTGAEPVWMFTAEPSAAVPAGPQVLAGRFAGLVDRVGLVTGGRGLHRIRHTVATALVEQGYLDDARGRLRHSRLDTTLRHYTDTSALLDDTGVADALQNLYVADLARCDDGRSVPTTRSS